jgi:hypothetical protein
MAWKECSFTPSFAKWKASPLKRKGGTKKEQGRHQAGTSCTAIHGLSDMTAKAGLWIHCSALTT